MLESERVKTEMMRAVEAFEKKLVFLKKQLLVYTPPTVSSQPDSVLSASAARQLIITRLQDGELRVYWVPGDVQQPLELVSTHCIKFDSHVRNQTIAPSLQRAVYASADAVLCFSSDGDLVWRYDLGTSPVQSFGRKYPNCTFSTDGTSVWVYRPDAMARRRRHDTLVVLNSDDGEVVAEATLSTVGEGAELIQHPDGRHVLLGVGEGQDGSKIFRATLTAGGIDLDRYEWDDRCLVDVAPDGQSFITIAHNQKNATLHRFPKGEVIHHMPIAAFGYHENVSRIEWSSGFLNADVGIISIKTTNEQDGLYHHLFDLQTGSLLGCIETPSCDDDSFIFLGDGTWIMSHSNSGLARFHGLQMRECDAIAG